MLVMYGTAQTPFSPGMRPKFTVPSGSRGVGRTGPAWRPRPRPPPSCAGAAPAPAPCCAPSTQALDENTATAVALRSAVRRLFVKGTLLTAWCPGSMLQTGSSRPSITDRAFPVGLPSLARLPSTDTTSPSLHRVPGPSGAHEAIRTAHFHRPVGHLAGLLVLHVDIEERVRVHPLDLGHRDRSS